MARGQGQALGAMRACTLVETCAGRPHEVVRVGLTGAASTHIIFVPGNPGIPGYYASTVESLADKLSATAAVVGFLGHSSAPIGSPVLATYGAASPSLEQCGQCGEHL